MPASDREALRRWYEEELQPRLATMRTTDIARGAVMGISYAHYIVTGKRIPHPRHYPNLAALVDVELPRTFAAVYDHWKTRPEDSPTFKVTYE